VVMACYGSACANKPTNWSSFGYGSIPIDTFLVGWTSIYQLFWCSPGVPGFWPIPISWFIIPEWGSKFSDTTAGGILKENQELF
jgi:hypothetical protein